jgi:hypothetical protein
MYRLLLRYQSRFTIRFFAQNRGAKIVTVFGFLAAFGFLVALCYSSFYYGFKYIARDIDFSQALTIYIIELFFLVSFALVYVSALMSGLFTMFRSANDSVILASPSYQLKLTLVAFRMFLSSVWPLLAIIIPALIAFRQVFGLSFAGLSISVLSSVVLIATANAFAIVTVLLAGDILDAFGRFSNRNTIITALSFLLLLIGLVWERFRSLDLVSFFQARMLDHSVPDIRPILHQFSLFPSHFSALAVVYSHLDQYVNAIFALGYTSLFLLLFLLSLILLRNEYLGLWQKGQEGDPTAHAGRSPISQRLRRLMQGAESPARAMLYKEMITFFRNTRGLLWALFILFIWVIQGASSRILSHGLASDRIANDAIPISVSSLQFAVILYFVSMFVLRYAFPSFSAEQKSMWAVRSAPLDLGAVFVTKLFFFTSLFSVISLVFICWNAYTLGLVLPLGIPLVFAVLLGAFFLTTFGLSLGAIFPNTETDDPERLSTTLPGIGFIFGALAYGVFGSYALRSFLSGEGMLALSLFIFLSLACSLLAVVRVNIALRSSMLGG